MYHLPEIYGDNFPRVIEVQPLQLDMFVDVWVDGKQVWGVELLFHLQVSVETYAEESERCEQNDYLAG